MQIDSLDVALARCQSYDRLELKPVVDALCRSLGFSVASGTRVLLKPNLISAQSPGHLACTRAGFVAAVAEWFCDHGAIVSVGDSPAFGTARKVMTACGITEALKHLPVTLVDFSSCRQVRLRCGETIGLAGEALDCDLLVNLPRVKAHDQLLVTMAVKNHFGAVIGLRKPLLHARFGDVGTRFEEILVDLLEVLPVGISLLDGVVAMHRHGPMRGKPFPLGIVAASRNPVALDSAMLAVLGIDPDRSKLMVECQKRGLTGSAERELVYPLLKPAEIRIEGFQAPSHLIPITFHPLRICVGAVRRGLAQILPW